MDNDSWYDIKQENGMTIIEKKSKNNAQNINRDLSTLNSNNYTNNQYNNRKKKSKIGTFLGVFAGFIIIIILTVCLTMPKSSHRNGPKKVRTFMLYMVGSDLESSGSMATYDLNDIKNANIDLDSNNVILMVGGSKKWHNFVNVDELAIYELTSSGFQKVKSMPVSSMGTKSSLLTFLDYSYDNYPSEKYDMIFWNHGLGALGLEQDEVKNDFLDITELSKSFEDSPFKDEKLEVVIFNNCLSGNFHFANVMSKYADYMVGSEEVMYVGLIIDRLNFIEDVKESDNGYDVGKRYVEKSTSSMNTINKMGGTNYDSTMAVIDLSNIDNLDKKVNSFFKSIDLDSNYYNVARARGRTYTYARAINHIYDTVDLYELVENLSPYTSDNNLANELKKEIKNTIKYNKASNKHSNGLSIYFPYYGNTNYIEGHLYYFSNLWKNNYTSFITNFYNSNNSTKRARRAVTGNEANSLKNKINVKNNKISITLTDEEKDLYQRANVYIFEKNNNKYNLLLKTNNLTQSENELTYNHYGIIKTANNNKLTTIYDDEYKVYESIDGNNVVTYLNIENGKIERLNSIVDSGENPSGAIFDKEGKEPSGIYLFNYELFENNNMNNEWNDTLEKQEIELGENKNLKIDENLKGYYVLVEMYDINNDTFYSDLKLV